MSEVNSPKITHENGTMYLELAIPSRLIRGMRRMQHNVNNTIRQQAYAAVEMLLEDLKREGMTSDNFRIVIFAEQCYAQTTPTP
jgi:hypothetical protein